MTDLVAEFFTRDLTEAEQEALSDLLERSPDAALNYERLVEQNYLATGLPQPTLPKGLNSLPKPGMGGLTGLGGSAKLLLLIAAAVGIALWNVLPRTGAENPSSHTKPAVPQGLMNDQPAPMKKQAPLQPSQAQAPREGEELSVVIDAPKKSLVTVRILNSTGKEVRALYTGFVEAGRWNIQWDGLLENGSAADAGNYRIDVQAGAVHQSKDIRIKLRPSSLSTE